MCYNFVRVCVYFVVYAGWYVNVYAALCVNGYMDTWVVFVGVFVRLSCVYTLSKIKGLPPAVLQTTGDHVSVYLHYWDTANSSFGKRNSTINCLVTVIALVIIICLLLYPELIP